MTATGPLPFFVRALVVLGRMVALVSLGLGLFAALGQMVTLAIGVPVSVTFVDGLLYVVSTLLLTREIYRARSDNLIPSANHSTAARLLFAGLLFAIAFVNLLALGILVSRPLLSASLIHALATLLLAGGVRRAKSAAAFSGLICVAAAGWLALAICVLPARYAGTPRNDGPAGAALAERVTELRQEHQLIGLAAMAMVDGQIQSCAADGERKAGSGVALELEDRWHLGSITKSITATMVGRLIEAGQLQWTDTIGARFPDATIHEEWKSVTLEQLLTHTAGAPANFSWSVSLKKPELGPACTRERRAAVLEVLAGKPSYTPGEKFAYSNVGYTIAGAMAEAVTGVSWEDLVEREVFKPLELNGAGIGPPRSPSATLAQPRGHRGASHWKTSVGDDQDNTPIMGPAGTVHMTLRDLCTYATDHLRGESGTGRLLSGETYQRLHTPRLQNYACGWVMKPPADEMPHKLYWHNGSNTMWYALVVFIPDTKMVIAVTSNDGDIRQAESAAWKIVKFCAQQTPAAREAPHRESPPNEP